MCRCVACNVILTPSESVRRFKHSGEFVDMCNKCLSTISDDVEVVDGNADDGDEGEYDDE
jgi:hypothetical protein